MHIIGSALAISLIVLLGGRLPFLNGHVQVVLDVVDLLHSLVADSLVGVRQRERLPKHLCVLAIHKLPFSSTDLLG